MRSEGNGKPEVCALNLTKIVRGEVAYVRTKGLDTQYIDQPSLEVSPLSSADARRQLQIFEPRINVEHYDVLAALEGIGDVDNDFDLTKKTED